MGGFESVTAEIVAVGEIFLVFFVPWHLRHRGAIRVYDEGGNTYEDNPTMPNITVGAKRLMTFHGYDFRHDPEPVESVTFESVDPAIVRIDPDDGDPLSAWAVGVGVGGCDVTATADSRIGDGVNPISATVHFMGVAPEAVSGEIAVGDEMPADSAAPAP